MFILKATNGTETSAGTDRKKSKGTLNIRVSIIAAACSKLQIFLKRPYESIKEDDLLEFDKV